MKKLSLEMLRLSTNEILERSQMKRITGGYGSGPCYITCSSPDGGAPKQHSVPSCSAGCLQGVGLSSLYCSCN
ncbi:natural product precursor [Algoriphagus ornithinivorans]|uniref:Natural product n=1 Tax=Algoriphagus ornithinivorans TaxID=226506 RepID=A0A1I5EZX3_9BACT|nr:natural product precursor [Algoriphagus ornithinivorans]